MVDWRVTVEDGGIEGDCGRMVDWKVKVGGWWIRRVNTGG
jgi:hypothetical protein